MDKVIRIGVTGTGWPARQHINGFKKIRGVEVLALCDINEERLNETGDEYDIPERFVDFKDMLGVKAIDAVCICTPNYLHVPQSILALKASKHVLCEKPVSINAIEARKIKKYRERSKKIFMPAHVYRFRQESRYLKDIIAKGKIGSIYSSRTHVLRRDGIPPSGWFTTKAKAGGGALIDCGVHMLDLVWWLMGSPAPSSAFGVTYAEIGPGRLRGLRNTGERPVFDVEELAMGIIRMADGSSITIEASWALGIMESESINCSWFGTGGGVSYSPLKPMKEFPVEIVIYRKGKPHVIKPELAQCNPFDAQAAHFVRCIRNNARPLVSLEDGITVMEMIDAIYMSSKLNKSVPIRKTLAF